MGYHQAGFEVVGIDIKPQPNYPFEFILADALEPLRYAYAADRGDSFVDDFDLIHASPPCQGFTRARKLMEAQGRSSKKGVDLLTPILPLLRASGLPYVVENVPGAPMRQDVVLCGSMFGLKVRRHRWFQSNLPLYAPGPCEHKKQGKPVGVYHSMGDTAQGRDSKTGRWVVGGSTAKTLEEAQEAMGIDWMPWTSLKESIPPAYTRWLGMQAMWVLDG